MSDSLPTALGSAENSLISRRAQSPFFFFASLSLHARVKVVSLLHFFVLFMLFESTDHHTFKESPAKAISVETRCGCDGGMLVRC